MSQRTAGLIQFQINGKIYDAKGNFSYGLGRPTREAIPGADGIHGFKEIPAVPFIEGEITDRGNVDLAALFELEDATVTLSLGNGKMVALREAWFAGEGVGNSDEANVAVRFEGAGAEEIT